MGTENFFHIFREKITLKPKKIMKMILEDVPKAIMAMNDIDSHIDKNRKNW